MKNFDVVQSFKAPNNLDENFPYFILVNILLLLLMLRNFLK